MDNKSLFEKIKKSVELEEKYHDIKTKQISAEYHQKLNHLNELSDSINKTIVEIIKSQEIMIQNCSNLEHLEENNTYPTIQIVPSKIKQYTDLFGNFVNVFNDFENYRTVLEKETDEKYLLDRCNTQWLNIRRAVEKLEKSVETVHEYRQLLSHLNDNNEQSIENGFSAAEDLEMDLGVKKLPQD